MSEASSTARHDDDLGAGLPMGSQVRTRCLANGLWVTAAHVPTARQLRLVGAVGVGYLDEPDERLGLAHLLEHALFLGSAGWPGASELSAWIGERGGRYNAHTGETSTDVHLSLPPEDAEAGLERLIDLLCRPCFDTERIAREVGVLDAEFHARLADPALHRLAALGQLYRPQHPASSCHAGNRATFGGDAGSLVAELRDFHRRHYRPQHMALAMLGPQPLEEQFALLERHGSIIGMAETDAGDSRPPRDAPASRTWRWSEPAGVAWQLPDAGSVQRRSTLELLWPLPDTLAAAHAGWLAALSARLSDGALAATLRQAVDLASLDVSLSPPGAGPALMLHLDFSGTPSAWETLVATCQLAVERAQADPLSPRPASCSHPAALDDWPREQACRLAGDNMPSTLHSPASASREALAAWLAADQCRLLWQGHEPVDDTWRRLAHTGTTVRALSFPTVVASTTATRSLSLQPAPRLASSGPLDEAPTMPRTSSPDSTPPTLWWSELDWPGTQDIAHCCLGWPAAPALRKARLAHWRRHALPLCQAARSQGLSLTLGGDERGDWLIAAGTAQALPALIDRAVTAWLKIPVTRKEEPDTAPGLIAQHLLTCLETEALSPPDTPAVLAATNRVLCWAGGAWPPASAANATRRVSERLPSSAHAPEALPERVGGRDGYRWLPAMGGDRAVMLEIAGLDDSPRSRWLLRLLGHCHDTAFHREMRQHRQLGYVAAVRYRESAGWPKLGYVIQSPHATLDTLRHAIDEFLEDRCVALARLDTATLARQQRGLLARHGPPETWREALEQGWLALRRRSPVARPADASSPWGTLHRLSLDDHSPWKAECAALDALTLNDLAAQAAALATAALPRRWWAHAPSSSN